MARVDVQVSGADAPQLANVQRRFTTDAILDNFAVHFYGANGAVHARGDG